MGTEPWVPSLLRSSPGLSVQAQVVKAMSPCLNRLHQHVLSFSDWTCFTVARPLLLHLNSEFRKNRANRMSEPKEEVWFLKPRSGWRPTLLLWSERSSSEGVVGTYIAVWSPTFVLVVPTWWVEAWIFLSILQCTEPTRPSETGGWWPGGWGGAACHVNDGILAFFLVTCITLLTLAEPGPHSLSWLWLSENALIGILHLRLSNLFWNISCCLESTPHVFYHPAEPVEEVCPPRTS